MMLLFAVFLKKKNLKSIWGPTYVQCLQFRSATFIIQTDNNFQTTRLCSIVQGVCRDVGLTDPLRELGTHTSIFHVCSLKAAERKGRRGRNQGQTYSSFV